MKTELKDTETDLGNSQNEFAVKDIYLAAYLLALGYGLELARSDGFNSEFFFKNVPGNVILSYYNNTPIKISAKALYDAFQNARRISRQIRLVTTEVGRPNKISNDTDDED
ncbi:MAG: hypothetical protein Q8Q65_03325 [bacterium]|nr:hypothetical protein [bacterium]